jgi:hypothetical protein
MADTNDDFADLMETIAQLRRQKAGLERALIGAEAARAAAAAGHSGNLLLTGPVAERLRVFEEKNGRFTVKAVNNHGTRLVMRDGRYVDAVADDVARELINEHPAVFGGPKSGKPTQPEKPASKDVAGLSDEDRARARAGNPWAKKTENLTMRMIITRRDPTLAAELRAAAGV